MIDIGVVIAAGITAILIMVTGAYVLLTQRKKAYAEAKQRKLDEEAYLEAQRQRMKANRAVFMKEIEQIAKARHPESTRHQRRTVASRYKQQIKSS